MRLVGWVGVVILVGLAVMGSHGERGMRDGMTGSYLGRPVADSSVGSDREKVLTDRVATQRY